MGRRHTVAPGGARAMRRFGWAALGLALGPLGTGEARANGRFPSANYFVAGPAGRNDVLALRTTFGLVLSRDGGREWSWVCEEAYGAVGASDPSISIGPDGNVLIATFAGLSGSDGPFCQWARPTGAPMRGFADITNTFDGRNMVGLAGPTGDDALVLSADGGRSWTLGARLMGLFSETADVAPNDPMRVYATAYARGGIPVLLRSDDGGRTVREVTRDFGGAEGVYIAGVDPRRPDVLYLRGTRGLTTSLLKSEDGGMSMRTVGSTAAEMVGFALSDDGETVWIASTNRAEGIQRSVRGGPWTRVGGDVGVRCLRYHAGLLFVCADELLDGYALGCSRDGGDTIDPLLSLRRLTGPSAACSATSSVGAVCAPAWSPIADQLRSIDASAPREPVFHDAGPGDASADAADVTVDTGTTVVDAGFDAGLDTGFDAGLRVDAPTLPADLGRADVVDAATPRDVAINPVAPTAPSSCHCRVGSSPSRGAPPITPLAAGALGLLLVARRRRSPSSSVRR